HTDDDFRPIKDALNAKRNKMVYGGKLLDEYVRNEKIRRVLIVLDRTGSTRKIREDLIAIEINTLGREEVCISNDLHILALARVSGARLLCSFDTDLHQDFTNSRIIKKPKGKIYQNRSHLKILNENCRNCRFHNSQSKK
ncbi:MAG: hypothetical protein JXB48_20815, partial [Candidatus Latescibacteria bacterium]|nr:hypothetical protein [Candidatus Latescibacterota bacterium]